MIRESKGKASETWEKKSAHRKRHKVRVFWTIGLVNVGYGRLCWGGL